MVKVSNSQTPLLTLASDRSVGPKCFPYTLNRKLLFIQDPVNQTGTAIPPDVTAARVFAPPGPNLPRALVPLPARVAPVAHRAPMTLACTVYNTGTLSIGSGRIVPSVPGSTSVVRATGVKRGWESGLVDDRDSKRSRATQGISGNTLTHPILLTPQPSANGHSLPIAAAAPAPARPAPAPTDPAPLVSAAPLPASAIPVPMAPAPAAAAAAPAPAPAPTAVLARPDPVGETRGNPAPQAGRISIFKPALSTYETDPVFFIDPKMIQTPNNDLGASAPSFQALSPEGFQDCVYSVIDLTVDSDSETDEEGDDEFNICWAMFVNDM